MAPVVPAILDKIVDDFIADNRIDSPNAHTRTFNVPGGKAIKTTIAFVRWLQTQYTELQGLNQGTLASRINRRLAFRLGYLYRQGPRGKKGKKGNLAQLAQAELRRRLSTMSVAELAELAKR